MTNGKMKIRIDAVSDLRFNGLTPLEAITRINDAYWEAIKLGVEYPVISHDGDGDHSIGGMAYETDSQYEIRISREKTYKELRRLQYEELKKEFGSE